MVRGQIAGGMQMGGGPALGETMLHEQGRAVNPAFVNYAMTRAADLPWRFLEAGSPFVSRRPTAAASGALPRKTALERFRTTP